MVGEDLCLPGGGVDVGVDLGGEDGFVAEHFLDDAEVGAALDEVRGEGMADGVGELSLLTPAMSAWPLTRLKMATRLSGRPFLLRNAMSSKAGSAAWGRASR